MELQVCDDEAELVLATKILHCSGYSPCVCSIANMRTFDTRTVDVPTRQWLVQTLRRVLRLGKSWNGWRANPEAWSMDCRTLDGKEWKGTCSKAPLAPSITKFSLPERHQKSEHERRLSFNVHVEDL